MNTRALQDKLTSLEAADRLSGVVLIERRDGVVFHGSYGYASRRWSVPCSLDTRFDTASITKLFTAAATLQQVEAGAFSFETSAVEYLQLDTSISSEVTVYQLLTHTSGIGDDADEEAGERYEDLWRERPNYSVIETDEFLPQFAHKPAVFPPGKGCRYCNVSYVLLGLMIERASGMTYRDYVRERVFGPADMNRSGFFHRNDHVPDVADGAEPVKGADGAICGWRGNIYSYPPVGSPDGGAHATAGDLVRFLHAVQDGALLGREMSDAMTVARERYKDGEAGKVRWMGYGFEVETSASGSVRSWSKDGVNVGASGILRYYPTVDATVVVLSNMEDGAWEPVRMIDSAILEG